MKRLVILLGLVTGIAHAQLTNSPGVLYVGSAPTGACSTAPPVQVLSSTGALYTCNNGTWGTVGGGGGTVTSFTDSSGLFSVATSTTTPTTTYATQTANTAFGNFTGSTAAPSFTATTGTGSPVSATSPTLVTPALGTPSAIVITNATGTCTACVSNSATLDAPIASPTFTGTVTTPFLALTGNGAASTAEVSSTGTIFTGGSGTTTFPLWQIQPTGATTETGWNTSGTFIGINSASGFSGNFVDFHLNNAGSSFSVSAGGNVSATGNVTSSGVIQATSANIAMQNSGFASLAIGSVQGVAWTSSGNYSGTKDTGLDRSAAGVVEANLGTAQGFGGSFKATGFIGASYQQTAASATGGTCAMSTGTSCTITIGHTYTTPVCIATQQSATLTGGAVGCTVSGTTVTITSAVANSETWGAFVFGNPN